MATIQTSCPSCKESVEVGPEAIVIDDEDGSYTLACPTHGASVRKRLDRTTRHLLRGAGCSTVEEIVQSSTVVLEDDDALRAFFSE